MFFTPETLATNSRMRGHWNELWANRNQFNVQQGLMVNAYRQSMTSDQLACNAVAGFGRDFWAEIDRQVIEMRSQQVGMEIVDDLMGVQTVLNVGKTAKLYNIVTDIADDVSVSLDGQAPYSFDHSDYDSDGDPIPVFSAGYGVNWRHAAGLSSVGLDLVLDSQQAKLRKFNKEVVSYVLDGKDNIRVQNYPGQGLRNHRNTYKVDLNAGTAIDLTTASAADLMTFFGKGKFGTAARANKVTAYDVMWVSPEIWGNLSQPNIVNGSVVGNVLTAVMPFAQVKDIRMTYALSGNEYIAYERRRDVVSPLVGMTTGVTALPRPLPNTNYNFQILAAIGLQVTKDDDGLSGVQYGADLT